MNSQDMPEFAEICLMCWWRDAMDCMCEELYDNGKTIQPLTGLYGMEITEQLVMRCWDDLPAGSETARIEEQNKRKWVDEATDSGALWIAVISAVVRFRTLRDEVW